MKKKLDQYLMLIAVIFWSGAFIAGKYSTFEFPPMSLTFFRFFFATIVIFIILYLKEGDLFIKREDILMFLSMGVIGMIGYHVLFFLALRHTSVINTSLIAAINPMTTTLLSVIFLKEKLSWKNILAIFVSFAGIVVLITQGDMSVIRDMDFNKGDLMMLGAVISWAIYTVISKKAVSKYSPLKATAHTFLSCIIVLLPLIFLEKPAVYLPKTTLKGWLSVLYMSIFASVIGYLIQQISVKKIGPSRTNIYYNLVPICSMILAYIFFKDVAQAMQILGGLMVITGVYINTKFR